MDVFLQVAELGFYLMVAHAVADRGLQPERLSRDKNRALNPRSWFPNLLAHGLVHGGTVAIATGVWWLGVLECLAHMWIDDQKAIGQLTMWQDQVLHALCKFVWLGVTVWLIANGLAPT